MGIVLGWVVSAAVGALVQFGLYKADKNLKEDKDVKRNS